MVRWGGVDNTHHVFRGGWRSCRSQFSQPYGFSEWQQTPLPTEHLTDPENCILFFKVMCLVDSGGAQRTPLIPAHGRLRQALLCELETTLVRKKRKRFKTKWEKENWRKLACRRSNKDSPSNRMGVSSFISCCCFGQ